MNDDLSPFLCPEHTEKGLGKGGERRQAVTLAFFLANGHSNGVDQSRQFRLHQGTEMGMELYQNSVRKQ